MVTVDSLKDFLLRRIFFLFFIPNALLRMQIKLYILFLVYIGEQWTGLLPWLKMKILVLTIIMFFVWRFKATFGNNDADATFTDNLKFKTIKQRRLSNITNYILKFNKYTDGSSWNEEAKMDAFLCETTRPNSCKDSRNFLPAPDPCLPCKLSASRIDSRISSISTQRNVFIPQNRPNIPFNKNRRKNLIPKKKKKKKKKNKKKNTKKK